LCAFSEDYGAFAEAGVTVLPLSVDATPSLKEFKAKYQMQVDLLSDIKREATRAFGVLRPASYTSQRAYFLVDTAGVIRWAHVEEHPGMRRENAEILAAITAALA
jgi:peroxiredoxin (alkyl hydroperoxide reductase subunit C)